jgi:hypothetical protein
VVQRPQNHAAIESSTESAPALKSSILKRLYTTEESELFLRTGLDLTISERRDVNFQPKIPSRNA